MPVERRWAVTLLFYTAVHLVKAHEVDTAPTVGRAVSTNHGQRRNYIANYLTPIYADYELLEQHSRDARYDLVVLPLADILLLHQTNFTVVRNHLLALGYGFTDPTVPWWTALARRIIR